MDAGLILLFLLAIFCIVCIHIERNEERESKRFGRERGNYGRRM